MRQRWIRIGILAVVLLAVVFGARLIIRIWHDGNAEAEERISLGALIAVALVMIVTAIWWGRLRPIGEVVADLAGAAVPVCVLNVLVGPFVLGTTPAQIGAGDSFNAVWLFAAFTGGGVLIGLLLVIMVGQDYKSRSLKNFAESKLTKPRRAVRR
jgi:Kef-type K+ transport system membrane component KefB